MKTRHLLFLHKMQAELTEPVTYFLPAGESGLPANPLIGQNLEIKFTGRMQCIQCGRAIKKTFQQGYCYPCMQRLYECNLCQIHPEKCRFYEGICDPNDWAHRQCGVEHVVYLAYASDVKVGITRYAHRHSRWIDQGAIAALPIIKVSNRYLAGQLEVVLKAFIKDKTDWRKMLLTVGQAQDLLALKAQILAQAEQALSGLKQNYRQEIMLLDDEALTFIQYPVLALPQKIQSYNLDKNPVISDKLLGIKGQYFIFEQAVVNLRKYSGYEVELGY
jgi:hypothetical protein